MASDDPTRRDPAGDTQEAERARFERREAEAEHREAELKRREAQAERREAEAERREAGRGEAPLRPAEPLDTADPRYAAGETAPPPAGGPSGDWRGTVATASGLNVLAGIWLIIAPFVLDYGDGNPYWNDIVFGAIVGILALIRISGAYRESWLSWINMLIGVWIFVSAFWLDDTARASWNDIILGAIVFFLGLISATASDEMAYAERPWYRR